jgi:hypothetical protein
MLNLYFTEEQIKPTDEKFLVGIDEIETIENGLNEFLFDGIRYEWFQEFQEQDLRQVYEKMTPYFFEGDFRGEFHKRVFNFQKIGVLSRWFLITVSDHKTDLKVTQYIENNDNNEGTVRYISSINALRTNNPTALQLDAFFSWKSFELSNEEQLSKALIISDEYQSRFHKLNVYNVGQGSLCSIASNENIPLVYYDMGGGWRFFKKTYPTTKRLCFTIATTIILSHWDWDHLETARRYSTTSDWKMFENKTWIVPKQDITSSYMKFLCKIAAISTVIVWPEIGLDRLSFWGGEIIKCRGISKNNSGLALVVSCDNNSITNVLHPADAAFKDIPFLNDYTFDGLVATHHGANFEVSNSDIPIPFDKYHIAYSYAHTRYGHPKRDAVLAYESAGWVERHDTINGNISFTYTGVLNVPCGGKCDLTIDQIF